MKPTIECDVKEQSKFYKKHQYLKGVRSRCVDVDDPVTFKIISESPSLPKINERYYTV